MKKILLFILGCVYLLPASPQQDIIANRHYMDFSHGGKINTGKKNMPYQIHQRGNYGGFSFRYSIFVSQHWGVYADTQLYFTKSSQSGLALPNLDKYYIIREDIWEDSEYDNPFMFSLGVTYRLENKNFCFRPYLGAGISGRSVQGCYHSYEIKEKGSNLLYRITYNGQRDDYNYLNGGVTASWKITRKFNLHLDVGYIQYITRQKIEYTQENMYTNEVLEKEIVKAPLENYLNVKVGVSFAFGFTMRKKVSQN